MLKDKNKMKRYYQVIFFSLSHRKACSGVRHHLPVDSELDNILNATFSRVLADEIVKSPCFKMLADFYYSLG